MEVVFLQKNTGLVRSDGQADTLVVVPAFNEQNSIVRVLREVQACLPEVDILVVNDCSTDETSAVARSFGVGSVIDLPCNLGIGGAMQTGFKYAMNAGYDYVVQIDGDGQHVPSEVVKLFQTREMCQADMVIGSRFLDVDSFGTTWCRRLGIRLFYILFRALIDEKVTDGTSGFRLYNRKALAVLARYYSSDYPEPDAIVLVKKHGLLLAEVGVEMRARTEGQSSITALQSPYYMAKVILTILFSCARPRR